MLEYKRILAACFWVISPVFYFYIFAHAQKVAFEMLTDALAVAAFRRKPREALCLSL